LRSWWTHCVIGLSAGVSRMGCDVSSTRLGERGDKSCFEGRECSPITRNNSRLADIPKALLNAHNVHNYPQGNLRRHSPGHSNRLLPAVRISTDRTARIEYE
jgi:hypothetical protein